MTREGLAGLLGLITVAATLFGLYTDVIPFFRHAADDRRLQRCCRRVRRAGLSRAIKQ